jgi:purine-binding chemotaxis protein CheW
VTIPAVVFPIGEDRYAVPAEMVREVVGDCRPTRVPTVASELVGAFNLRGEVVPVFDLAALLGVGTLADGPFVVVVATSSGPAGLLVGGLPAVAVLAEQVAPAELRGARGVHRVDTGLAVLVDVEALLSASVDAVAPVEDLATR